MLPILSAHWGSSSPSRTLGRAFERWAPGASLWDSTMPLCVEDRGVKMVTVLLGAEMRKEVWS